MMIFLGYIKHIEQEGRTVTFDLGQPDTASYQTEQIIKISTRASEFEDSNLPLGSNYLRKLKKISVCIQNGRSKFLLGLRENIWFDYSALPFHVPDEEYPFPSTKRYIMKALDLVGSRKLMWGTDVPWLLGYATYKQYVQLALEQLSEISPNDRTKMLGETAREVYLGKRKMNYS